MPESDVRKSRGEAGASSRQSPLAAPGRRELLGSLAVCLAAGAAGGTVFAQQTQPPVGATPPLVRRAPVLVGPPLPVEVTARPLSVFDRSNAAGRNLGRLDFRGGLVLGSTAKDFGGWSGLVVSEDGRRALAVSDRGNWMMADLVYQAGRLAGIANAVMGDIAGVGGQVLTRGRDRDAETVALLDGTLARGTVLIGFERNHRIGRFPVSDRGLGAPLGYLKMPADARKMSMNKGLEAVTVLRGGPLKGSVLAFAEEYYDSRRNHTGWIWPGGIGGEPQRLGLTNIADFAITDVASMPDGSLIVLERKFRWLEGVKMRLRHVRATDLRSGALLEGQILLEADMASEIDNMEGLALSRDARGQTVLTLISDNNFNNFLQRNLVLQFALRPEEVSKAPAATPR